MVTANDLVIPAGEDVVLEVTSRDVIHSFGMPSIAGTRDAVPGRISALTIGADRPGIYDGQCKEFCGLSHANMRARVVALPAEEFQTWLDQQQQPARLPTDELARAGQELFQTLPCAQCHQVRGLNDPLEVDGDLLVAGHAAPDLTHLMSRGVFASASFPLYGQNGEANRNVLEQWLRNPQDTLPMDADAPPYRGMPDLNLTEEQIDQLVVYLQTLGPPPPLPDDERR
ncbi:MAG: c-type cytochrome [Acidimicrobiales bacterium]